MSDKEYDRLYDQLVKMEEETGIVLGNSPTLRVGYKIVSDLPSTKHQYPMLSLEKTKDVDKIVKWIDDKKGVLSWKLDGLTIVASYKDGVLEKIVTRGNGEVGEDVTHNAPFIAGLPQKIPFKGDLIVRGEAVIDYDTFQKINETVAATGEDPYKNPRNLASSSVRLLDTSRTSKRGLQFLAFTVANPYEEERTDIPATLSETFEWLSDLGFSVVEHMVVTKETVAEGIQLFSDKTEGFPIAVDGLVLSYDVFDRTLGTTGKYPKHSIAFKWEDETMETTLRDIHWSASKTGLLNPVAVFDAVELEGTTVQRASVHNVSVIQNLNLHLGDKITIYKANKSATRS